MSKATLSHSYSLPPGACVTVASPRNPKPCSTGDLHRPTSHTQAPLLEQVDLGPKPQVLCQFYGHIYLSLLTPLQLRVPVCLTWDKECPWLGLIPIDKKERTGRSQCLCLQDP